jgi:hypothetical protein
MRTLGIFNFWKCRVPLTAWAKKYIQYKKHSQNKKYIQYKKYIQNKKHSQNKKYIQYKLYSIFSSRNMYIQSKKYNQYKKPILNKNSPARGVFISVWERWSSPVFVRYICKSGDNPGRWREEDIPTKKCPKLRVQTKVSPDQNFPEYSRGTNGANVRKAGVNVVLVRTKLLKLWISIRCYVRKYSIILKIATSF